MNLGRLFRLDFVFSVVAFCGALGALGGCNKSEEPPAAPPRAEAPATAPLAAAPSARRADAPTAPRADAPTAPRADTPAAAAQPVRVTRIDLGNSIDSDEKVESPATSFKPSDTIYASVLTEGSAPSVSLRARWLFEGSQLVNDSTQTIEPNGPTATEFHVSKPDGWPRGKYKVEVQVNGEPAASTEFTVAD